MAGGRLQHNPDVPGWQAPFTSYFAGFFAEPPGATTLEAKASRGPSAQWVQQVWRSPVMETRP